VVVLLAPGIVTRMPQGGTSSDHLCDVVSGELRELVSAAGLAATAESDDEGAVLLEEEDIPRLLVVHVAAEHAERGLVIAGLVGRAGLAAATGGGLLHEPGDVVVEERQRLLRLRPKRFGPRSRAEAPDVTSPGR
jgi:hypothetical protein